jgi:lipopolysaccharide assembly outer membrane protein LptD (OstA)
MKWTLGVAAALSIAVTALAQTGMQERRACVTDLIRNRVQSQQPVRLSAEAITLTGDTLRLAGHAKVWFDDVAIQADEAIFNRATKGVELVGSVNSFFGSSSDCSVPPRLEFR